MTTPNNKTRLQGNCQYLPLSSVGNPGNRTNFKAAMPSSNLQATEFDIHHPYLVDDLSTELVQFGTSFRDLLGSIDHIHGGLQWTTTPTSTNTDTLQKHEHTSADGIF